MSDNVTVLSDEKYLEGYINRIGKLNNTNNSNFFYIGFNLLELHTLTQYHLNCGYDDIYQFADKNFKIGKSSVHYMMQIVKKFAEEDPKGGYKKQLKNEYQDYKYSQLRILCSIDKELHDKFMPTMTIADMEAMKKFFKEEQQKEEEKLNVDPPDEEPGEVAAISIDVNVIKIPFEEMKNDFMLFKDFIEKEYKNHPEFNKRFMTMYKNCLNNVADKIMQIENLLEKSEGK